MQESTTIHSFLKFPPYVKRWHGATMKDGILNYK